MAALFVPQGMSAFTIFFCGTGSNSYDFAHTNYHKGELISTLARNHPGHEFVDWMIVDGPGSGSLQEAEKWAPSGNYSEKRGTLQGKGWEENVAHAIAVLSGVTDQVRTEYTKKERSKLRSMGVGVEEVPGYLWGTRKSELPLHPRISPQELQQKKIEILGQHKVFDRVNVIGWSRGGVTCHMFANALAETEGLSDIPVNIFACDPVPGSGQFQEHRIRLRSNVREYVAVYAEDERSRGFTPILPICAPETNSFIMTIPGRHATLVGNATVDGNSGFNCLFAPGTVTRDLAEKHLTRWGTSLQNKLDLTDPVILQQYDEMIGQLDKYTSMHEISYTYFTQKGERAVGNGDGAFSNFGGVGPLQADPSFINIHHRTLFANRYPLLYTALFEGARVNPTLLDLHVFNMKMMYPKLYKMWFRKKSK